MNIQPAVRDGEELSTDLTDCSTAFRHVSRAFAHRAPRINDAPLTTNRHRVVVSSMAIDAILAIGLVVASLALAYVVMSDPGPAQSPVAYRGELG